MNANVNTVKDAVKETTMNRTPTSTRRLFAGGALAVALGTAPLLGLPDAFGVAETTGLTTATVAYAAGDVCDICGVNFDPGACAAAGGEPYDSVEEPWKGPPWTTAATPEPAPAPAPAPAVSAPAAPSSTSSSSSSSSTEQSTTTAEPAAESASAATTRTPSTKTDSTKKNEKSSSAKPATAASESSEADASDSGSGVNLAGPATLGGIAVATGGLLTWWWLRRRKSAVGSIDETLPLA